MKLKTVFTALMLIPAITFASPDIRLVDGVEVAESDTRFDAVAAFTRTEWAGGDNYFGNGTLIAPDKMIMARHLLDANAHEPGHHPTPGQYTFRFRRHENGTVGSLDAGSASYHQVTVHHFEFLGNGEYLFNVNPDIVIAHLSEPVTHIEPIAVAPAGYLSSGMIVHFAGWGRTIFGDSGSRTGRVKYATGTQRFDTLAIDQDGVDDCSRVVIENANGQTAKWDSGGAFIVFSPAIPFPRVKHQSLSSPLNGIITPVDPIPLLVGVITSYGNAGDQAHWGTDYQVCDWRDCFWRPDVEGPCNLHADLNGDFRVTEEDFYLAMEYLGPCTDEHFVCQFDHPRGGFGNGDGVLDLDELMVGFRSHMGKFCKCLEDFTGDGFIDDDDLQVVLDNLGPCDCVEDDCPGDVNQDRFVDMVDAALVLDAYGVCDH